MMGSYINTLVLKFPKYLQKEMSQILELLSFDFSVRGF